MAWQPRRNGDGRLSCVEVGAVRTPTTFASIDTSRDGRITMSEWPWSRRTFIQQDENSDGSLSRGPSVAAGRKNVREARPRLVARN